MPFLLSLLSDLDDDLFLYQILPVSTHSAQKQLHLHVKQKYITGYYGCLSHSFWFYRIYLIFVF